MPKVRSLQTSFNTGVMDPRLHSRVRLDQYYQGMEVGTNVLCMPQGGVKRRPGTIAISGAPSATPKMIRFEYNTEQAYLHVLSASVSTLYLTVYKNGSSVYSDFTGLWSGITVAEVQEIQYIQSADTLILFHENYQPMQIVRGATDATWAASLITFTNIPQYDFGTGAEDSISATRGWPKCGTFYQGRLWMGGSTQLPQSIWGSVINDFYNLDTTTGDDNGIFATLNTDQVNGINGFYPGRHLQIFTTGGEFYVPAEPIAQSAFYVKRQTGFGSLGLKPVSVDGSTIFVDSSGVGIRHFLYTELEQAYTADSLSITAPHLINSPVDIAVQISASGDEANYVYIVNGDGTMAVLNTLRSENISAWTKWETNGQITAAEVVDGVLYLYCERTDSSGSLFTLEYADPNVKTDYAIYEDISQNDLIGSTYVSQHYGMLCRTTLNNAVRTDYTAADTTGYYVLPKLWAAFNGPDTGCGPDFTTWTDVGTITITENNGTAPDGTETMVKISADTAGARIGKGYSAVSTNTDEHILQLYIRDLGLASYSGVEMQFDGISQSFYATIDWGTYTVSMSDGESDFYDLGDDLYLLEIRGVKGSGYTTRGVLIYPGHTGTGAIEIWAPHIWVEVGLNFNTEIKTLPLNVDFPDGPIFGEQKRLIKARPYLYQSNGVYINGVEIPDMQFGTGVLNQAPEPYTGFKQVYLDGWDRYAQATITQVDPLPLTLLSLMLEVKS